MKPQLKLVIAEYPDTLNIDALDEWREYRASRRKPLSELAEKKTVNMLLRFSHEVQQAMVDAAIMNDWAGLHVIKTNDGKHQSLVADLTDRSWAQ